MFGGGKFKIIHDVPKYKYVHYDGDGKDNKLHTANNIDNDILNENSEFMIGSVTKIFTGLLISILDSLGLLSYDDQIDKYIDFNKLNDFSDITIDDVLHHNAGFIKWITHNEVKFKKIDTSFDALKIFMQKKLIIHKKGKKKYSSIGFVVLGAIIEKITKMSYIGAVKKYILIPCKMTNTGFGDPNIIIYKKEAKILSKNEYLERYMINAGGGLYSTVNDLIKFATNIPNLLTPNQINKCYGYDNENGIHTVGHIGRVCGGLTIFKVVYTQKWKIKNITIEFNTNTEIT